LRQTILAASKGVAVRLAARRAVAPSVALRFTEAAADRAGRRSLVAHGPCARFAVASGEDGFCLRREGQRSYELGNGAARSANRGLPPAERGTRAKTLAQAYRIETQRPSQRASRSVWLLSRGVDGACDARSAAPGEHNRARRSDDQRKKPKSHDNPPRPEAGKLSKTVNAVSRTASQRRCKGTRICSLRRTIAAIAPPALIAAMVKEASKRGVTLEDANVILPPTRQYNETEIRQAMVAHGIDGVLVVNVTGDTGVQQRYAGTIANTSYSETSSGNAMVMGNMIYGSGMSQAPLPPRQRWSITTAGLSLSKLAFLIHRPAANSGSAAGKRSPGDRFLWATLPAPPTPLPQFSTIFRSRA
jgi:hypothetical protein